MRDSEVFGNEINAVADISLQGEEGDRNWNSSTVVPDLFWLMIIHNWKIILVRFLLSILN